MTDTIYELPIPHAKSLGYGAYTCLGHRIEKMADGYTRWVIYPNGDGIASDAANTLYEAKMMCLSISKDSDIGFSKFR
jgi:hypothetical protein|tara:strand:- start:105 stop:338 length:234 start_codon:yes stop_codon:yes gene_type:complete